LIVLDGLVRAAMNTYLVAKNLSTLGQMYHIILHNTAPSLNDHSSF